MLDTAHPGSVARRQQEREAGQASLFGGSELGDGTGTGVEQAPLLPNLAPLTETERLTKEKEILGFYISGHPLEPFRAECELFATHTVSQLGQVDGAGQSRWASVVTAIKKQVCKRTGAEFARLTVEDFSGSSEVLVFPEAWAALSRPGTD